MARDEFSSRWIGVATGLALLLLAGVLAASAGAAQRPLAASNYSTEAICATPLPGLASCLAEGLVPETKAARAHSHPIGMVLAEAPTHGEAAEGDWGLRPEDLHNVYELPLDAPGTQAIGIVDAYDDPTIESDLRVYDEEFGLPACTKANGCFNKINQAGNASPLPATSAEWATEITLDVETAHAVCQNCKIDLVEASSNSDANLETAVEAAVAAGADEVSNSYGSVSGFETLAFDHPGVVITASTGDWGYDNYRETAYGIGGNYPASSPDVVAVGGTELSPFTETWTGETAWSSAGSGCSTIGGGAPPWQTSLPNWASVGCGTKKAVADVAADADPYSGVAIYDSTPYSSYFPGWATFGGTSLASPIVAAEFALAGGSHGVEYPAETLYANRGTSGLHDITGGANYPESSCHAAPICHAGSGWDGPTGVGAPIGLGAFQPAAGTEPTVTGVSPGSGPTRGKETVTITGTHLAGATAVHFGTETAAILTDTESSITARSPAGSAGTVDVTVTGSTGIVSATSPADQYEYVDLTPRVTAIYPTEGPPAGGTLVTLEGTGLSEISMVEFGAGYYAPVEEAEEGRVTALSPAHPEGTVQVFARGPKDANSILFTYATPPPKDTLTVHLSGSGYGSVAISPPGAFCSFTCSHEYEAGTAIILSETPDSGSTFAGWSGGGCSGTTPCHLTLAGDTEVTATFNLPASSDGPWQTVVVPMLNPNPAAEHPAPETSPTSASNPAPCLAAAQKAYRRAARQAAHSSPAGRTAALRKAKRAKVKADENCRKHP
jgi:hypothetical protein